MPLKDKQLQPIFSAVILGYENAFDPQSAFECPNKFSYRFKSLIGFTDLENPNPPTMADKHKYWAQNICEVFQTHTNTRPVAIGTPVIMWHVSQEDNGIPEFFFQHFMDFITEQCA